MSLFSSGVTCPQSVLAQRILRMLVSMRARLAIVSLAIANESGVNESGDASVVEVA